MQVEFLITTHNSILTMGAMGPVGGSVGKGALVAGASAAASTASIAAVNSSMNADGDVFKQLKTISKDTWDTTTSKESVKNIVIAAAAGGLATGLTNLAGGGSFTTPAANSTNTVAANASFTERVSTNFQNSFQDAAINTVSSTAAQSAINGDSFVDALKNQGKNILIYTAAKVAANEIGRAYHGSTVVDANGNVIGETSPTIGKPEQILLHAGLGAATSALTGNDAASGAVAGVIGELAAEGANKGGVDVSTSIQIANLSGAISSITYGGLAGQSDEEMADNAWEGSRIGRNAARENALKFKGTTIFPYPKKDYDLNVGVQYSAGPITVSHGTDGTGASANAIPSLSVGGYINVVPSGESSEVGLSYGIKDRFTADFITTNKGNFGFGFTGGFSIAPPVLVNSSVNLKLDN